MKTKSLFPVAVSAGIALAVVLVTSSPMAHAQSVSCKAAKQTCYEAYVGKLKVKTVAGLAQIKL